MFSWILPSVKKGLLRISTRQIYFPRQSCRTLSREVVNVFLLLQPDNNIFPPLISYFLIPIYVNFWPCVFVVVWWNDIGILGGGFVFERRWSGLFFASASANLFPEIWQYHCNTTCLLSSSWSCKSWHSSTISKQSSQVHLQYAPQN